MPFKKIVKETTETNQQLTTDQQKPFVQAGLNDANVPTYETPKLDATQQEQQDAQVQRLTAKIDAGTAKSMQQQARRGKPTAQKYGLSPPQAEEGPDEEVAKLVASKIWNAVVYNMWYKFFTQETLQLAVNRATRHDYRMIMELYNIQSLDMATNLAVLSLVDIVIIGDNSYSMNTSGTRDMSGNFKHTEDFRQEYEDLYRKECSETTDPSKVVNHNNVSRWQLLALLLEVSAFISTLFDDDGISVRFLNEDSSLYGLNLDNVKTPDDVKGIFKKTKPCGGTPTGGCITRVYNELFRNQAENGTLKKPVLFRVLTDGQAGDNVTEAIRGVRSHLVHNSDYGSRAVLFSFSQVGNDKGATEALQNLDTDENPRDPDLGAGAITDCTSNFELEKEEYDKAQAKKSTEERVPYTPGFHLVKENCGVIIEALDKADEV